MAGLAIARGDMLSMLLLGGLVVTATAIVMREHGEIALRIWVVAGAVAFPLLRVPRDEPLLTFDRAWIASLVLVMVLGAGERPGTSQGAGRLLWWALGSLTVAFGLRAMTTTAGLFPALKDWVEAVVLPAVLCRVAWRVIDTPDRFRRLTGAMAVVGTGLGLSGIAEKVTGYSLAPLSGGVPRLDVQLGIVRVAGPYNVPELYALMLTICLAGTLYWMRSGPRRTLVPGLAACLSILAGIGLTLFRAGWLAAVVTIAVMLGAGARRSGRWLRIGAGGGVVVLLALLVFGRNEVVATRLGDTGNVYGRLGAYAQSIEMFTERPLFGVGVGRFYAEQQLREDIVVGGIRSVEQAHSSFMAVLVEQGIAGILPFLAVLAAGWLVARSLRRRAVTRADLLMAGALTAAGLSYLVMSATLTLHTLLPSNGLLAILLGAAARRLGQLEDPEEAS